MPIPSFVFFASLLLFIVSDYYLYRRFSQYILSRNWSKFYSLIYLVLSSLAVLSMIWVGMERYLYPTLSKPALYLNSLLAIWYFPKLFIVPILLLISFVQWSIKKWFQSKTSTKAILTNDKTELELERGLPNRRKFVQNIGWAAIGAPFVLVTHGVFKESLDFHTERITYYLPNLPHQFDGFTIAQISDIHCGSFYDDKPMQEIRMITNALRPDLIAITGDFVNFSTEEIGKITKELEKLKAPFGVKASLGNHDHYMNWQEHLQLREAIRATGIDLLVNENRILKADGATLQLAGTDNTGFKQNFANLPKALENCTIDTSTILLAHDPTFWDRQIVGKAPVDLMLSGHTHGGQVAFHFLGKELSIIRMIYDQWAGSYTKDDQHLYINRGVGTTGPPIRIGVPPEITYITLKKAQKFA